MGLLMEPPRGDGGFDDRLHFHETLPNEEQKEERMSNRSVDELMADDRIVPSARMHHLLVALGQTQEEAEARAAPFKAVIKDEEEKMAGAVAIVEAQGRRLRAIIEECLNNYFADEDWKYKGEAGSAQIVRPKNRISYDTKGLETLRLSSDETNRLIGHLRSEKPTNPYLRVKVK